MICEVLDLGLVDYEFAEAQQRRIFEAVKTGAFKDTLVLAEFLPVYTIGRSGSLGNLLVSGDFLNKKGIKVHRIGRGGDITAHNPGQLVVYPIFDLARFRKDLNWYIRSLEEVIIRLLEGYRVFSGRKAPFTGVWAGGAKIASIGISVSRWVTSHGLSLNVNNDLSIFDYINPCGQKDCEITSLSGLTGDFIDMAGLKQRLINQFEGIFSATVMA